MYRMAGAPVWLKGHMFLNNMPPSWKLNPQVLPLTTYHKSTLLDTMTWLIRIIKLLLVYYCMYRCKNISPKIVCPSSPSTTLLGLPWESWRICPFWFISTPCSKSTTWSQKRFSWFIQKFILWSLGLSVKCIQFILSCTSIHPYILFSTFLLLQSWEKESKAEP